MQLTAVRLREEVVSGTKKKKLLIYTIYCTLLSNAFCEYFTYQSNCIDFEGL